MNMCPQNQPMEVLCFTSKIGTLNISKLRPDLNINKGKELESIFIEHLAKNLKNILDGCICMHPKEFNNLF